MQRASLLKLHVSGWQTTVNAGRILTVYLAVGGSVFTIVTSAGGEGFTLATSGAGVVTSIGGEGFTIVTGAAGSAASAATSLAYVSLCSDSPPAFLLISLLLCSGSSSAASPLQPWSMSMPLLAGILTVFSGAVLGAFAI